MKRFTDAGRQAIKDDNLYAALSLALTLPDICGSLEDPGPGKSQQRYERWCKRWLEPKFLSGIDPVSKKPMIFVQAKDVFQLRCSLIHSGSSEIDAARRTDIDKFIFFDKMTGAHLNVFRNCTFNGVQANLVQLKADLFSEEMFKAVDEWDVAVTGDSKIQSEKAKLLLIHSKGATIHGVVSFS